MTHPALFRVVITGSECTGKTTLAEALAAHYGTASVPEYARRFVAEKGSAPDYVDVDAIARGQMALEDEHAATATVMPGNTLGAARISAAPAHVNGRADRALLIQDTDLLSTVVYSNHYYGDCPAWIEEALRRRAGNLYLLADIDVPWTPDGEQRDRSDRREEMQELFRRALRDRGLHFVAIRGSHEARLAAAISAIDAR